LSKSPYFKRFIHLARQLGVGRWFSPMFALAKSNDPEKADIRSTLPPKASYNNRNNPLIFNALRTTKSTPPSHLPQK
jgi:hypothetical protein